MVQFAFEFKPRLHSRNSLFCFPELYLLIVVLYYISHDTKATSVNLAERSGGLALISMLIGSQNDLFANLLNPKNIKSQE